MSSGFTFRIPDLDSRIDAALRGALWPLSRIGEGISLLAARAGLDPAADVAAGALPPEGENFGTWVEWAAMQQGIEAEPVDAMVSEIGAMLQLLRPGIIRYGGGFLLIERSLRGRVALLGADLLPRWTDLNDLVEAIGWPQVAPIVPEIEKVLDHVGIAPKERAAVRRTLLADRPGAERSAPAWILRLPSGAGFLAQLRRQGLFGRLSAMLGCFALTYGLEIAGWSIIGSAALDGRLDFGWLSAWLLVLTTMVAVRLGAGWIESHLALDFGRLLKARLLNGALRQDIDQARRAGAGHMLAIVIEAQALEASVTNGALGILVALIELCFAIWILSQGAGGALQAGALLIWMGATSLLALRYYRSLRRWCQQRLELTHHLVEQMSGHRTRLAQEQPMRRDLAEDHLLDRYGKASRDADLRGALAMGFMPSGWMLIGLITLLPAFSHHVAAGAPSMAIAIGGLLLAQRALGGIAGGIAGLGRAVIAWEQLGSMFRAGREKPTDEVFVAGPRPRRPGHRLIDAARLDYSYPGAGGKAVDEFNLAIQHGDRILVEGSSGSGKSTLAALLTGLRNPDRGLLLIDGLDRPTLGSQWNRMVAAAPQFHENHIFTGSFAFNLLMGRQWPPSAADLAEAERLCLELGLGELLDRMPARLQQQVGETGWQLSHGERSRIFLARALLQRVNLTILDESFAALDPETLGQCLDCADRHADALMVIAHP